MSDTTLEPPIFVAGAAMLVVGLLEARTKATVADIPGQWRRFMQCYPAIADRVGDPLAVCRDTNAAGDFDYLCGTEVTSFRTLPEGLVQLLVPAVAYAVFRHRAHLSRIADTYAAIRQTYGATTRPHPDAPWLERHAATFDPGTGLGGVEIWIPYLDPSR